MSAARIILLMGVTGAGKTTIGRRLAAELGWPYFEADDFHSAANRDKMGRGIALDDADRAPWLAAIRARMDDCLTAEQSAVFTCSALKEKYRDVLLTGAPGVKLVFLTADIATIQARVYQRKQHFMKAGMVKSQFDALEVPRSALTLDARQTPEAIVTAIRKSLV